jgi:hypothetical protein
MFGDPTFNPHNKEMDRRVDRREVTENGSHAGGNMEERADRASQRALQNYLKRGILESEGDESVAALLFSEFLYPLGLGND